MDSEQYRILTESLRLCKKLQDEMERDKDRIHECFNGDLRRAYLEANGLAENEVVKIRNQLQAMMQQ